MWLSSLVFLGKNICFIASSYSLMAKDPYQITFIFRFHYQFHSLICKSLYFFVWPSPTNRLYGSLGILYNIYFLLILLLFNTILMAKLIVIISAKHTSTWDNNLLDISTFCLWAYYLKSMFVRIYSYAYNFLHFIHWCVWRYESMFLELLIDHLKVGLYSFICILFVTRIYYVL